MDDRLASPYFPAADADLTRRIGMINNFSRVMTAVVDGGPAARRR